MVLGHSGTDGPAFRIVSYMLIMSGYFARLSNLRRRPERHLGGHLHTSCLLCVQKGACGWLPWVTRAKAQPSSRHGALRVIT